MGVFNIGGGRGVNIRGMGFKTQPTKSYSQTEQLLHRGSHDHSEAGPKASESPIFLSHAHRDFNSSRASHHPLSKPGAWWASFRLTKCSISDCLADECHCHLFGWTKSDRNVRSEPVSTIPEGGNLWRDLEIPARVS